MLETLKDCVSVRLCGYACVYEGVCMCVSERECARACV